MVNSRTVDSPPYARNKDLLDVADELVGWYTQDWVVRKRVCSNAECAWGAVTVEVTAEDWKAMQKHLQDSKGPK